MKRLLPCMPYVFFTGLALVTILSLIPSTSVPQSFQFWDKAQHALAFIALTVTGAVAFPDRTRRVYIGLVLYGGLIEIMQATLTTTRFGDVVDWVADGLGVMVGVVLYATLLSRLRTRLAEHA